MLLPLHLDEPLANTYIYYTATFNDTSSHRPLESLRFFLFSYMQYKYPL